MEAHAASPLTMLVLALVAGVLGHLVARHVRISAIVVLLAVGAGLGPDGLGWIDPPALGAGLFAIVELAVAIIVFEGGLNLEINRLQRSQRAIRNLVTWGALLTLTGGAVCARLLLEWPWVQSLLFGSLIVVTGPTVIGPLVSELRLRPRVSTVLEAEGVLIDPVGAILAVLMLEIALAGEQEVLASGALGLLARLGFGVALGLAGGAAMAWLLRVRRIVPEGAENVFTLAAVLGLFQACNELVSQSGILAVAVAGVVVGNVRTRVDRDLREFKDQLSVLLIGLLFVLLAADVRLVDVRELGWAGVGVVAALILVVRPLNVWLATLRSDMNVRERLFIAWLAPRGIVAAALASLTAAGLEAAGLPGGIELRALVFLTILGTVLLAGLTAGPVATLLGVRMPGRDAVAILGAQGLGFALASELRDGGYPVVFLDSNPQNCRRAEEEGFAVVFGNALEERTLTRARFSEVGTAIGLTPNETLNGLFVSRARELFNVPQSYVAFASGRSNLAEIAASQAASPLFERPHDLERWDVRIRNGDVSIELLDYVPPAPESEGEPAEGAPAEPVARAAPRPAAEPSQARPAEAGPAGARPSDATPVGARRAAGRQAERTPRTEERWVLLTIQRGERVRAMSADLVPRAGDVASVAIHIPERAEALAALAAQGWVRVLRPESQQDRA